MQLDLFTRLLNRVRPTAPTAALRVGGTELPVEFVRNPKARRYILRLTPERVARVTVPRFQLPAAYLFASASVG